MAFSDQEIFEAFAEESSAARVVFNIAFHVVGWAVRAPDRRKRVRDRRVYQAQYYAANRKKGPTPARASRAELLERRRTLNLQRYGKRYEPSLKASDARVAK